MKRNDWERKGFSAIGECSLITVFTVLCMSIFAVLSISSVQADCRLAEQSYAAVQARYAADCRAEEILNSLRRGTIPNGVTCISENNGKPEENTTFIYSCPVSDTQELEVKVSINKEKSEYEILRWKIVSTISWESEDTLNLWDGEAEQEE
ncbi:MAG: hypothetical protein PUE84_06195 [Firmicutes bacterium]|nr:hypothetical protein [Bacillota bacterium]